MADIGEIKAFAFGGRDETIPPIISLRQAGWLAAEGQQLPIQVFQALHNIIQSTWGADVATQTFRIPDCRGQFLRGWSHGSGTDPDAAARPMSFPGGAAGDSVGSSQPDAVVRHSHGVHWNNGVSGYAQATGFCDQCFPGSYADKVTNDYGNSAETRPKNVNVMYCIYTGLAPIPNNIRFFG